MFADVKTSFFANVLPADPYAETSTRSPGETNIRRSSVPSSVNSEPGDHSHYSTPEADSVGRGKFCSSASSKLG